MGDVITWRRLAAAGAAAAVALTASACGSSPSSSTTTTPPSGGSSTTTVTTMAAHSSTTTTPPSGSAAISRLEETIGNGQAATYEATYSINDTSAGVTNNGTLKLAHDGTSSLVGATSKSGVFEEITKGSSAVVCFKSTGSWQCLTGSEAGSEALSLTALVDVFGSKASLAVLQADAPGATDVTSSSGTFAGQPVTCVTFHSATDNGVYTCCTTSSGVIAEAMGQSTTTKYKMVLTNYSSTVPTSTFTPPAKPVST